MTLATELPHFHFRVDARGWLCREGEAEGVPLTFLDSRPMRAATGDLLPPLSPAACDLIRIARAVHGVDRWARRGQQHLNWARRLHVELALQDPGPWKRLAVDLSALLHFLTDDEWVLTFEGGCLPEHQQQALFQEKPLPNAEIALCSGGLDSVAGIVDRLRLKGPDAIIPLAVISTTMKQQRILDALRSSGLDRSPLLFKNQMQQKLGDPPENSARSRGFLFLSAAAACAHDLGLSSVVSFETGMGALNLPMNDAQVGAMNTRAMHPRALRELERIIARGLRRPIQLRQPYFFLTKGELCRAVGDCLPEVAMGAYSCDETERNKPRDGLIHCGKCSSCVYRRLALAAALKNDPTPYRYALAQLKQGAEGYEACAFATQARHLLEAATSWADLTRHWPGLRNVPDLIACECPGASETEREHLMLDLVRRHAREALAWFAQVIETKESMC